MVHSARGCAHVARKKPNQAQPAARRPHDLCACEGAGAGSASLLYPTVGANEPAARRVMFTSLPAVLGLLEDAKPAVRPAAMPLSTGGGAVSRPSPGGARHSSQAARPSHNTANSISVTTHSEPLPPLTRRHRLMPRQMLTPASSTSPRPVHLEDSQMRVTHVAQVPVRRTGQGHACVRPGVSGAFPTHQCTRFQIRLRGASGPGLRAPASADFRPHGGGIDGDLEPDGCSARREPSHG